MITADSNIFFHAANRGSPYNGTAVADNLWRWAEKTRAGFRQLVDARLALALRYHGVLQLATQHVRDFQGFGFKAVWNPL